MSHVYRYRVTDHDHPLALVVPPDEKTGEPIDLAEVRRHLSMQFGERLVGVEVVNSEGATAGMGPAAAITQTADDLRKPRV